MLKTPTRRIIVAFPESLLGDIDRFVPARKRNEVIVAATEDLVRKMRLLVVLDETAGAWTDENHPDLSTSEDVELWLRDVRARWRIPPPEGEDGLG
jgi:hypothetical protein